MLSSSLLLLRRAVRFPSAAARRPRTGGVVLGVYDGQLPDGGISTTAAIRSSHHGADGGCGGQGSCKLLLLVEQQMHDNGQQQQQLRYYHSRAHPKPTPVFPLYDAMEMLLQEAQDRNIRRKERFEHFEKKKVEWAAFAKARSSSGTSAKTIATEEEEEEEEAVVVGDLYDNADDDAQSSLPSAAAATTTSSRKKKKGRPPRPKTPRPTEAAQTNETVELAVNLNLDPRKPGQALRGSVILPHGTGKTIACAFFSNNTELQQAAKSAGATVVGGGEEAVDQILAGDIDLSALERAAATRDMLPLLKRAARMLGPRSLMPNPKDGTLLEEEATADELTEYLQSQVGGNEIVYRTDNEGIIHVGVGKVSFGVDKLLDNVGAVMRELFNKRPEKYGKGKKKVTGAARKYLLRASVTTTQGRGIRLDERHVDPTSGLFLNKPISSSTAESEEAAA